MSLAYLTPIHAAMRLPDRIAFSVFGVDVYWYGLFLAVGILAAILLAQRSAYEAKLPGDTVIDVCLICIPLAVLFARVFYVASFLPSFMSDPVSMLYIWDGGLSVYGAICGALLGLLIYSIVKKLRILSLTDMIAPGLVLAQGLVKWGDFFNQEGYGPEVINKAQQWFPLAVLIEKSDTIHYALFFYEFVWCVLVFLFLWFVVRNRALRLGALTLWYLLLFGLGHALFELLRTDRILLFGNVPTATFVCGILALVGLIALLVRAFVKPVRLQPPLDGENPSDDKNLNDADSGNEEA